MPAVIVEKKSFVKFIVIRPKYMFYIIVAIKEKCRTNTIIYNSDRNFSHVLEKNIFGN